MIDGIAAAVHRVAQDGAEFTRKRVRDHPFALDQAGQTFRIPGTIISKTEPVAAGHLVTVTGTFQTPGRPFSVSLQTVVNEYSGGQQ